MKYIILVIALLALLSTSTAFRRRSTQQTQTQTENNCSNYQDQINQCNLAWNYGPTPNFVPWTECCGTGSNPLIWNESGECMLYTPVCKDACECVLSMI
jgi:hypothetical protein